MRRREGGGSPGGRQGAIPIARAGVMTAEGTCDPSGSAALRGAAKEEGLWPQRHPTRESPAPGRDATATTGARALSRRALTLA